MNRTSVSNRTPYRVKAALLIEVHDGEMISASRDHGFDTWWTDYHHVREVTANEKIYDTILVQCAMFNIDTKNIRCELWQKNKCLDSSKNSDATGSSKTDYIIVFAVNNETSLLFSSLPREQSTLASSFAPYTSLPREQTGK